MAKIKFTVPAEYCARFRAELLGALGTAGDTLNIYAPRIEAENWDRPSDVMDPAQTVEEARRYALRAAGCADALDQIGWLAPLEGEADTDTEIEVEADFLEKILRDVREEARHEVHTATDPDCDDLGTAEAALDALRWARDAQKHWAGDTAVPVG